MRRGQFFLHEHPHGAKSWGVEPIKQLLKLGCVHTVRTDQCQFGLETPTDDGGRALAKKPTRFMSNSKIMLQELDRKCGGGHAHQPLMGGRAANAAFYPKELLRAIVRGMAKTRDSIGAARRMEEDKWDVTMKISKSPPVQSNRNEPLGKASEIPLKAGGIHRVEYNRVNFKDKYTDEYTGEVLPDDLVHAASMEELNYFNQLV